MGCCLILFAFTILRSDSAGIYLTASDFQHHHLSYITTDQQLRPAFPGVQNIIQVRLPTGQKMRFAADSIYGYHKDGQDFRFIGKAAHLDKSHAARFMAIQAVTPVYLYSYSVALRFGSVTYWFYSFKADTPLRLLTPENLTRDFPNRPALAQEIKRDKKLRYSMATHDEDGQLRVAKIMAKYLPASAN